MFTQIVMMALLSCNGQFTTEKEDRPCMCGLVRQGTMASLSTDYKGTPFGSLVPYGVDAEGRPYIFVSTLSVHTKNILKNSKASIMVYKEDKDDPFNSQRVTFVGKMVKITDAKEREALNTAYLKKYPAAKAFNDFGDFHYYRLEIERIHYIGGFGDIQWVEWKDYKKEWKDGKK